MKCLLDISEVLVVRAEDDPQQMLTLDFSQFYCRLFETTRDQCRDYLEEIVRWSNDSLENYEYLSDNLMHVTSARRKYFGFKR